MTTLTNNDNLVLIPLLRWGGCHQEYTMAKMLYGLKKFMVPAFSFVWPAGTQTFQEAICI